jgi:hypothetical protein
MTIDVLTPINRIMVRTQKCAGCLYGKTPVVGLDAAIPHRRRMKVSRENQTLFPCHCHTIQNGNAVACRGWYDASKNRFDTTKVDFTR